MARRTEKAAQEAAQQASEAARVLQARGQEKVQEKPQETSVETEPKTEIDHGHIEKLLNQRPQIQAMDEIIKKRGLNEPPKEEPKVEDKKEEKTEVKVEQAADVSQETSEVEPKGEDTVVADEKTEVKTIRVKVDGEEFDAPAEEVEAYGGVRPFQIAKATENRLKKITDTMAELRKYQAQSQPQQPPKQQLSDQQFIAERMDKIRFGTADEAASAQLEINARLTKNIDPIALSNHIIERTRNEQAVNEFKKEFADIAGNPILFSAAQTLDAQRRNELAKSGQQGQVDWQVFYRKIGNEVRSAFGRSSQPPSAQTAGNTSQQSKEAKKASITTLPTASGSRAAMPAEEKTPTPEEQRRLAIDDMKKKRGQSTG